MVLVVRDVDALLVKIYDDRWSAWVSCLVSFTSSCARALVGTRVRLWSAWVIVVTCGTICAQVVVARGLAGPWAVPALGRCCVSFYFLYGLLAGRLLFDI